jgi:hypothetical protein
MPSFVSPEQAEMLRGDLERLRCPDDADQIEALRAMCSALGKEDPVAFKAAWKRLKVGYGPRIGVCDEQFPRKHGGSADPPRPEELTPEAANVLRDLRDSLDSIVPAIDGGGTPPGASVNPNG